MARRLDPLRWPLSGHQLVNAGPSAGGSCEVHHGVSETRAITVAVIDKLLRL